jgi:hypothetical protein
VDVRAFPDAPALLAAMQFTLIVVSIAQMKAAPVPFDIAWAEKRYGYGAQSPLSLDSLAFPTDLADKWSNAMSVPLQLRHHDQDANGHVNSGKYLELVECARYAAIARGHLPDKSDRPQWMSRFWVEYNGELHMVADSPAVIDVSFALVHCQDGPSALWTRYEFRESELERKVCAVVTVESVLDGNKL